MNRPLSLLLLCACPGTKEDTATDCAVALSTSTPADGATDVPTTTTVSLTFDPSETTDTPALYDAAGAPVAAGVERVDGAYVLTPEAELAPSTTYHAVVHPCAGTQADIQFTTSPLSSALVGKVWHLEPNDPSLAELWSLLGLGGGAHLGILVEYLAVGSHTFTLRLAPADAAGAAPFACSPTIDGVSTEDSDTQTYSIPIAARPLWFPGARTPALALGFSTEITTPDGQPTNSILTVEVPLTTELLQTWGSLLGTDDPAEVCADLAGFGASCADCLSDPTQTCVTLGFTFATATADTAGPIGCIDEIECHPDCATSTCADPTEGQCDP